MESATEPRERRGLLPRYTLKDGNTFLLADALGDIQGSDDGLFTDDTRMLCRYELEIAGRTPSLLGAAVDRDNALFTAHLTNRPLPALGEHSLRKGVIHIERTRFLYGGRLYEQLKLTNFSEARAVIPVRLLFAADFVDIFELQGHSRPARGTLLPPEIDAGQICLAYRGLDELTRVTRISFSHQPKALSTESAEFLIEVARSAEAEFHVEIGPAKEQARPGAQRFRNAERMLRDELRSRTAGHATISTSGRLFNQWLEQSSADLALLTTPLPTGPYPYAGIPWFATPFGRDGIIAALQMLWLNPALASGVLVFLASTQAAEESAFRDSQPGKILHEMRRGEMAALREIPFGRYYGGVDTTPLFVMLAGAYERRTGDPELVDRHWPQLLAATAWIEQRMARSPTGFLDYARGTSSGLVNQAWKDSQDSIFHADGSLPRGPVAVVEVQGYAYAAFQEMAELATVRGHGAQAEAWRARAEALREQIERRFWLPELNFYALAIDGDGAPCAVRASNAGHLLFCGVPSPEHAAAVATELLSNRFTSGWGLRTLATAQPHFNPMSYHNGSIWPHDAALCAHGIARYGARSDVAQILSEIFEAAIHFGMRLPELYCGFPRTEGHGPVPYPVACMPQAWAAGAAYMLLQAVLGVRIDGRNRKVYIEQPMLPIGIEALTLNSLSVGATRLDVEFRSFGGKVLVVPTIEAPQKVEVLVRA